MAMRGMRWILVGVASASMLSAWADGRGYEPRTVPVNAGVVMFNANDTLVRDVYTFYAMDRRTDLKPLGLSFRNPFAPAGTTRNQAAYWLVDVSRLNDNQLARYKILLISRTSWGGRGGMTAEIREKLRRFVDGGGVLWVDVPREGASGTLFFPEVAPVANRQPINIVNLNHPLLRGYYTLTPAEIANLGLRGRGFGGGALNISANRPVLQIVTAVDANTPVIAAATYGSGRIIVSAAGIAAAISAPLVSTRPGREGQAFELGMDSVPDLELKFAYNLVRWAGAGSSDAFNARRANAVADQYGAPLGVRWRDEGTQYGLRDGAPVVYGGLVFVVSGDARNSILICYDAVPSRDLDGDGRADDGIPDYERGESFDKVWEVNLGGQSSPPVVVETPSGLQVVVLVGNQVRGYWALPRDREGRIPEFGRQVWSVDSPAPAASTPTTADGQIPAPIVIDNTLLVVPSLHQAGGQQSAGFYAVLLSDNPDVVRSRNVTPNEWYQPRTGNAGNWLLPAAAGYVPNYGQGGGNDIVVYFGTTRDVGGTGTNQQEGIQAFWLGAKGEVLTPAINSAGVYQGYFRSRITGRARYYVPDDISHPLHPRVFRINNTTREIVDITERCRFNQAEQGRITYDEETIEGYTFIVDYYIDWAYATNFNIMFRTFASLPPFSDSSTVPPQRLRGFTLAPNGVLYITTGTDGTDPNTASGSVIALQEQSPPTQQQTRGGSKVLWRWQSHGGYQQVVPGPERPNPVIVPPSTVYREPNEYFMRFVGRFLRFSHDFAPNANAEPQRQWMNFTFKGAPLYYDGAVYAFAEGQARVGPFGFPYTVIVALDAEPEQFVIDLGAPIDATGDVRISQRDYGRSGPNPITNIVSTLTYSPNSPNPDIKVDFTTGQIRITGFAQADGGGQIRLLENVLSLTQPVQVSIGNTFNTLVDPDSIAGNWNNLRWYAVLLGQQLKANPVVVGDTMYLPCEITVPTDSGLQTFGGILGIATDPYRLQPDLAQRKDQAGTVPRVDPNNPLKYQSIIRWPFIDDLITDLERDPDPGAFLRELFRRFAQGFQTGTGLSPIAVGEGLLVISSGQGLHAYSRQSTIIADESRVLEVDTAGRVVWSTENTQLDFYTGSIVASKARYPITPNARVYRYGENELLIVEPERNRVAIIDRAGAEIRTITQFIPDRVPLRDTNGNITQIVNLRNESVAPNSNYIAGAPTNLRNPTDVTVWTEFVPADRNPYTNPQPLEYWIHYTITDAGNARVVDIVDRYQADPQTYTVGAPVQHPDLGPMLGVLYWMTPSQRLERNYRYVSAQRFEYWDGSTTRIGFATLVQNTAASAFEATGMGDPLDPRTPEAGMITLQLIVNGRDQTIYIRRMTLPDGRVVPILAPVAIDTNKRSARGQGDAGLYLLVTTSTGVYELQVPLTGTVGDTLPVTWMLTNEAYTNAVRRRIGGNDLADDGNGNLLRPILFKPRQARYLPNGNVLIVNGYNGTTLVRSGNSVVEREFPGEVFELDANDYNPQDYPRSDDLGFSNASIVWSTLDRPELSGSSQLRKPSSADRGGF
jgi:hypothetical protein